MTTVSFKQGVNGYSGTIDTSIREASPKAAPGISGLALFADGDSGARVQALLAFTDLFGSGPGQIPVGATITSATLTIRVTDATTTGVSFSRMLTSWSELSSWNALGNGVQLNGTEAASAADLTINSASAGFHTYDLTSSVQAWLSGATTAAEANAANMGWVVSALGTDQFGFRSSESAYVPVLTVTYDVPGTGTPQLALGGRRTHNEGNSGSTAFTFTVTRTGDTTGTVGVNYAVAGTGTAPANGADFVGGTFPSGTITFASGENSKTITVNVAGDVTSEPNETFRVTLSNSTGGAQISGATAVGTILNDEGSGGTGAILGVRIYDASAFGPGFGSTDPTDVVFDARSGCLFVCDSEVDESPFHAANNFFKLDGQADPLQAYSLRGFTSEPTGLALWDNPNTGGQLLFISDDNVAKIFVVDLANPTVALRSFSTKTFGAADPEDLSIDPVTGHLFIVNGASAGGVALYEVTQTGSLVQKLILPTTIKDPEAIVYDAENDQFYISGGFSSKIFIVSREGAITGTIDILSQYPNDGGYRVFPKGLELAPASDGSGHLSLWVADYGKDQVADGRLIEIMLDRPAPASASTLTPASTASFGTATSFDDQMQQSAVDLRHSWDVDFSIGIDSGSHDMPRHVHVD